MTFSILNLLLVLVAAFIGGRLASRLGYPAVLGEILMGILLGPPILGLLQASDALTVLADLGVLLMMLYVGMEIDFSELKGSSKLGAITALGGFIFPFLLGTWLMLSWQKDPFAAIFVGIAMGVTSLATKSRILLDLGVLDTRIASIMMSGAFITDTLSLFFFAAIIGLAQTGALDFLGIGLMVLKTLGFFLASWVLGVRVFPVLYLWLKRRNWASRSFYASLSLMIALAFAELAELAGLHGILGAFLAGIFLREAISEKRLSFEITELVKDVSIGFLAPIFFLSSGFVISFEVFRSSLPLLIAVIVIATVTKILGTLLAFMLAGGNWREGLVIGLGMNDRGAVEIILAGIALRNGLIDTEIYTILVFMAVVTTATVPFFLTWGTNWLERHNLLARAPHKERKTIIVGAGAVSRFLALALAKDQNVCLIDSNQHLCQKATELGLPCIYGNALDSNILQDAGLNTSTTLIALTPNPDINVLIARHAYESFKLSRLYVYLSPDARPKLIPQLELIDARTFFGQATNLSDLQEALEHGSYQPTQLHITELNAGELKSLIPFLVRRGQQQLIYPSDWQAQMGDEVFAFKPSVQGS